uniref:Transcriptional adapter 1 n=1 Tax=Phallusia mammillata TaxID=59560 RepID=A0A6F9DTM7_9ASCI|nr:transcriptional adapter 1-like [Phallusia mammillata]
MAAVDPREQLITAKKRIVEALGDKEKAYWLNMKRWFKHQITKEEFDAESRRLFQKDERHFHNEFLLAVLTKCHVAGSSSVSKDNQSLHAANKAKKTKRIQAVKRKFEHRFVAVSPMSQVPSLPNFDKSNLPNKISLSTLQQPIKSCSRSLEVPTVSEMIGFVSVVSWEMGLDEATDDVVAIATDAVHIFLKNLLSAIFSRRSAYQTPYSGNAKHSFGQSPANPYLFSNQNNPEHRPSRLSHEEMELEEIKVFGKESQECEKEKMPVNTFDLLHTLKTFRNSVIPSHTVYSMATERTIMNLWHPDHEEIKQDKIFAKLMKT